MKFKKLLKRSFFTLAKSTLLLALFCVTSTLCAGDEEIRVHLTTQSPLSPLYVGQFEEGGTGHFKGYLKQLQEVLEFDLKHNGFFKLLNTRPPQEKQLRETNSKVAFNPQQWKEWGIAYAIKGEVNEKKLHLFILDVHKRSLKQFEEITLTGELSKDRTTLHKLSDAITQALFNLSGVANSRLLYSLQIKNSTSDDKKWIAEIWECDWDGENSRPLTRDNSYNVSPAFVASNNKNDNFLYVSYQQSQPKVFLGSISKRTRSSLISLKGNQLLPALSPQRDRVAFICDAAGRPDLFLQKLSPGGTEQGKAIQLFSYPNSTQASPTFSPDGKKIAFVSDKDGKPRIYVINANSSRKRPEAKLLTKKNPESSCPNWSPDGLKIAYSAKTDGIRQLWLYDLGTEEEKQLTFGPGNKENPCWAPDSLHLVFNSTDSDSSELYTVNLNQPDAVKITSGPGKKHYPTWGKR